MDTDILDAPAGWDWQIDDELAHHVWNLTANSEEVGFGPDPPILLETAMGFFDERSLSDNINNWYMTRKKGLMYNDHTEWWQIGSVFQDPEGDVDTTSILFDNQIDPHPLRSKLSSQQYTINGGMFTYEFDQWQGEEPSGMMRIPVPSELLDDLREEIAPTPFEEFQFQSRPYSAQFATDGTPDDVSTFAHPHYRAEGDTTQQDYMELFDIAFDYMEQAVRLGK